MAQKSKTVVLNTTGVSFEDVIDVARYGAKVEISDEAKKAIDASRKYIDDYTKGGKAIYGVSTGFGALADKFIEPQDRVQLQKSLIRSHAAGVGAPVEREVVRALMTLRLKTLASGRTGVRPVIAQTMAALLKKQYPPYSEVVAWCPGGLHRPYADFSPSRTSCIAVIAVSTAPRAASYVPSVSGVVVSKHHQPRRPLMEAGSVPSDILLRNAWL
jgi:hypothetical protein